MTQNFQSALFLVAQGTFWVFLIRSWLQVFRSKSTEGRGERHWLSLGSLLCATAALLLTAAMTIYSKMGQKQPYDRWEGQYLFYTAILSFLGIVLGIVSKRKPRIVGLLTSVFTLLIAFADAIGM